MKKFLKENKILSSILGIVLLTAALSNPVTYVEKMFLPQNNFVNPGFESNMTGVCLGDSSGAAPTTDQSCSPTPSLTMAYETSNPINGAKSLKISKGASNRQGEFIAFDFTIERGQRSSSNTLKFNYEATSNFVYGTADGGTQGDIRVFIADKTTSQVIAPYPNNLDGSGKYVGQWQASGNRTYQLLLWIPTTTTLSWDLTVDRFSNALSEWVVVNSDSNWVSYTPTFTGFGTPSSVRFRYRKQGTDLLIEGEMTPGTSTAVIGQMTIPSGLLVDSSITAITMVGRWSRTSTAGDITALTSGGRNYLSFGPNSNSGVTEQNASSIATSGQKMSLNARVPIQGWTSGYATPGVAAQKIPAVMRAYKNAGSITANTTIASWTTTNFDSVGAWNGSTGQYTVKYPGYYQIDATITVTSADLGTPDIRINGSVFQTGTGGGSSTARNFVNAFTYLNVGDVVTITRSLNGTISSLNTETSLSIKLWNDPSAFLTIPKVAYIKDVKSAGTDGGTFTSGSFVTRTLNTLEDPFGIVSLSSNQFTLQPGTYRINARAPAYRTDAHKIILYNITTSSIQIPGDSAQSSNSNSGYSYAEVRGIFSITSATVFEIRHRATTTQSTTGLGVAGNLGTSEVYTTVEIQKLL